MTVKQVRHTNRVTRSTTSRECQQHRHSYKVFALNLPIVTYLFKNSRLL